MSDMSDIKAELLVLKAENAELRRERDFYFQQVTENGERAHGAIDALNAENAKLRELVKECHELLQDLLAGWALQPLTVEIMEQRMRALGIEVDA